jgi:hypothetical protein
MKIVKAAASKTQSPTGPPISGSTLGYTRPLRLIRHTSATAHSVAGIDLSETGQGHALVKERHGSHDLVQFPQLLDAA